MSLCTSSSSLTIAVDSLWVLSNFLRSLLTGKNKNCTIVEAVEAMPSTETASSIACPLRLGFYILDSTTPAKRQRITNENIRLLWDPYQRPTNMRYRFPSCAKGLTTRTPTGQVAVQGGSGDHCLPISSWEGLVGKWETTYTLATCLLQTTRNQPPWGASQHVPAVRFKHIERDVQALFKGPKLWPCGSQRENG